MNARLLLWNGAESFLSFFPGLLRGVSPLESDAPDSRNRGEMTDLHHSSEVSEIKSYHMECY